VERTGVATPVRHAKLASVNVRDVDAAIEFWRDRLGFELRADAPYGEGERWVELMPPGAVTGVTLTQPGNHFWQEPGGYGNLIFATEDIDSAYEELASRGVEFSGPVMRPEGGPPPMAFFADQDGTQFLLVERDD